MHQKIFLKPHNKLSTIAIISTRLVISSKCTQTNAPKTQPTLKWRDKIHCNITFLLLTRIQWTRSLGSTLITHPKPVVHHLGAKREASPSVSHPALFPTMPMNCELFNSFHTLPRTRGDVTLSGGATRVAWPGGASVTRGAGKRGEVGRWRQQLSARA
jgi:hypothetical protein